MMHVPPEGSSPSIPNNLIFELPDVLLASNTSANVFPASCTLVGSTGKKRGLDGLQIRHLFPACLEDLR